MYHKFFIVLMLSLFATMASAQYRQSSDRLRPKWLQRQPTPTNSTFRYATVSASAGSLEKAREKCLSELISSSGLTNGIVAVSDYRSDEHISQQWDNGKLSEKIERDTKTTTSATGEKTKLYIKDIDEYWTRDRSGMYLMTKLYAESNLNTAPLFDNVEVTKRYGAHGLWRSAIIPGWGQFYKGSYLKGGLILGGAAVAAAGIIFTENQRSNYVRRIGQTHDVNLIRSYQTKRDHFATARNICIGAIAALYVYNLIDAVAAPGARRVVVKKRHLKPHYALVPDISAEGNPMMTASMNF